MPHVLASAAEAKLGYYFAMARKHAHYELLLKSSTIRNPQHQSQQHSPAKTVQSIGYAFLLDVTALRKISSDCTGSPAL